MKIEQAIEEMKRRYPDKTWALTAEAMFYGPPTGALKIRLSGYVDPGPGASGFKTDDRGSWEAVLVELELTERLRLLKRDDRIEAEPEHLNDMQKEATVQAETPADATNQAPF